MKAKLDTTSHFFQPKDADIAAAELNDNDPDWNYVVRHDPKGTGYSLIDVYDENGDFVATY